MKVRRALVSVSDKNGLLPFVKGLADLGITLISTGGTAAALREAGLTVISVDEVTGHPEILGGRVKTLHPRIHGGILARAGHAGDAEEMAAAGIEAIDLVVVNLYPFEEWVQRRGVTNDELIEQMEIGETERNLRMLDSVIRYLTVKVDENVVVDNGTGAPTGHEGPVGEWRRNFIGVDPGTATSLGLLADTFETAITWDRWPEFDATVRAEMGKVGLETLGDPSAIVPVRVGAEGLARIASRNLSQLGAIANLVEYPAVPQGGARFRVQVMADHTDEDILLFVSAMLEAMRSADSEFRSFREMGRAVTASIASADEAILRTSTKAA